MTLYNKLIKQALFRFDAESAHGLGINALKLGMPQFMPAFYDKRLEQKVAGIAFKNPVGMAAGFDKNGDVPEQVLRLGFGFTEIGTVTPKAQSGNPKPRIFRLPDDGAVINRLGFNNDGHLPAMEKFERIKDREGIIGVNIGANKDSDDRTNDYLIGLEKFYHVADYFAANISSPNTPGLRDLQAKETLSELLSRLVEKRQKLIDQGHPKLPIFLKIAPDLTEEGIDDIAEQVLAHNIDGLIVSNTTITRSGLKGGANANEAGGMSGRPLLERSNIVLAKMRKRVGAEYPIIGVGGIDDGVSAASKIEAGADLIQLYTGLIYKGPTIALDIAKGLANICERDGLQNIIEIKSSKTDSYAAMNIPG